MEIPLKKSVQYVRGAIDAGQFVPMFKNYAIEDGQIQGSDGIVTMNASISLEGTLCVHAQKFARAVASCVDDDDIELSTTDAGHLRVKQGRFRVIVPVVPANNEYPWVSPDDDQGETFPVPENFLEILAALRPFVGTDATRPWANGVRINEGRLYATNNAILVMGAMSEGGFNDVQDVILPARAVEELLRINVLPKYMLVAKNAVTFMHARTWWLRAQRIVGEWPDVQAMLDNAKGTDMLRITDDFRASFNRLFPFGQDSAPMFIIDGHLSTSMSLDEGAAIEGFEFVNCAFAFGMMKLILASSTHVGFARYPKPVPFVGKTVRGIVAPYKLPAGPVPTEVQPKGKK